MISVTPSCGWPDMCIHSATRYDLCYAHLLSSVVEVPSPGPVEPLPCRCLMPPAPTHLIQAHDLLFGFCRAWWRHTRLNQVCRRAAALQDQEGETRLTGWCDRNLPGTFAVIFCEFFDDWTNTSGLIVWSVFCQAFCLHWVSGVRCLWHSRLPWRRGENQSSGWNNDVS